MILEISNFIHFLGLAFGLGGATIAAVISRKAAKDKEVGKSFMKIMPSISKLIWIGLILLTISGILITIYVTWPINKELLIIKHILVVWIFIFGIVIGISMKKMKNLSEAKDKLKIEKARKQMKIFSTINLILWYLVTLMSAFV